MIEARLKELGIELPSPSAPAANYVMIAEGRHTRTAIVVNALPFGVAVEIEAQFEVKIS